MGGKNVTTNNNLSSTISSWDKGEIKYGIDREYEYSNNGNIGSPQVTKELPDFKIHRREPIIFIRKNFHYDSLSGNRDDSIYRNTEYTIVIYY